MLLFVGAVAMLSLYPRGGHCLVTGGVTMAQYEHSVLRVIDEDTLVISAPGAVTAHLRGRGTSCPPIIPLGDIMPLPPMCGCFVPFP